MDSKLAAVELLQCWAAGNSDAKLGINKQGVTIALLNKAGYDVLRSAQKRSLWALTNPNERVGGLLNIKLDIPR